jgi:putative heme transporter
VERRRVLTSGLVAIALLIALYLLVPRLVGLEDTWNRVKNGDPAWLALAVVAEAVSFAGYVWLLRAVSRRRDPETGECRELPRSAAWRITLAGVAATRIVTVGGAGGIAVTVIGLRDEGFSTREASERQAIDLILLYAVFFGLIVVSGLVLAVAEEGHAALTIVPAAIAAVCMALTVAISLVPSGFERNLRERWGRRGAALAAFPAILAEGVRGGWALVRRGDPALIGAFVWWLLDVAALAACLWAFGGSMNLFELLMAYLVGHIFNILPVPGGVGPVEGGIIGALVAFGVPAGLALVATLAYQLVSVWLPAVPGAYALWRVRHHHVAATATNEIATESANQ